MANEGLKVSAERAFLKFSGPYDGPLSSVDEAWNVKANDALASGKTLTLQDYREFREQLAAKGLAAALAESGGKITANSVTQIKTKAPTSGATSGKSAKASSWKPSGPSWPYTKTESDLDKAVSSAVMAERRRVAMVFATQASIGRERVCADLLAHPKGFSGAAICAELANMPTDSSRAREQAATKSQKASAVWEKAIARNNREKGSAKSAEGPQGRSSNVWDQAIAKVYGKGN